MRALRAVDTRPLAIVCTALAATAFAVARPPVGDLWAALARQSAAEHGVGLKYWFSWFGGTVPGHYSVLIPYLTQFVNVAVLGAAATVMTTALCFVLLRGSRHPAAGTWIAAVGSSVSLWSGRVPFALGCAAMLGTLLCVRANRRALAALGALGTALVSPVAGAFLILGMTGLVLHDSRRRVTAVAVMATSAGCLLALLRYFGAPGPEGFTGVQALLSGAAILAMLFARPPAYLRTVLFVALAACPVVAIVPNGLGSNFERLAWICLPVATAATARARLRVAVLISVLALSVGMISSAHDLWVAAQPMSTTGYSSGLVSELGRIPGIDDVRVEVVPDGTHVVAYQLLGRALEARGFETQSDNALDAILQSPRLDAASYRAWLDDNAVGYVALDRHTLKPGVEDSLVRSGGLPYLHLQWSDTHWLLWRVSAPTPVVSAPAHIVGAGQAQLTVVTPRAARLDVRVRWSRFLRVRGAAGACAQLAAGSEGWTALTVCAPGRYVLSG